MRTILAAIGLPPTTVGAVVFVIHVQQVLLRILIAVGILLERTNALEFARDDEEPIRQFATGFGTRR